MMPTRRIPNKGPRKKPAMSEICEHGCEIGKSQIEGLWAGGVAFCECCKSHYGYIDSFSGGGREWRRRTTDKDRCPGCGGQVRETSGLFGNEI